MDRLGQRRFVATDCLANHHAQIPLARYEQPVLVQPAPRKAEQSLPIGGARQLIAQYTNERPALRLGQGWLRFLGRISLRDKWICFGG